MKISRLEVENVKRIHAAMIEPSADGLTIIGGKNRQGKTSVLDAIAWALGGERYRPTEAVTKGSSLPPRLKIIMDNGLVVERKGKNSDLKVTDPSGQKAGQTLLNEFVEELAINMPKFMEASGKEKAETLLQIIGVGDQLHQLERQEKEIYQERLYVGRTADQKEKFAREQPFYPDAPQEPVSAADLIREQQEILARNGQRQQWRLEYDNILKQREMVDDKIASLEAQLAQWKHSRTELEKRAREAVKSPAELRMESTEELEQSIENIEMINRKVQANLNKAQAEEDAKEFRDQYTMLTDKLDAVRKQKISLLDSADLPLPGLSVKDGELIYNGQKWDNMSSAEQMIVSTSIVRKLNPKCGFVLLDKLEAMDLDTLKEFGSWLEQEGLQAIATRVSTGEECSIIITDGYVEGQDGDFTVDAMAPDPKTPIKVTGWVPGQF
ncbi:MAG TPA: chromosome segregation protein SMC [Lachnospiraceae bacterium]|nr:chromosome segregation protein SMC [Lachnospiraceae bacterium]